MHNENNWDDSVGWFTTDNGSSWSTMRHGVHGDGEEDLPLAFTIEGQPRMLEF
jgi:hypothetical protein